VVKIAANPGESFLDRMISLVEGASRQKTPERDRAPHPPGRAHDFVFVFACVTLVPLGIYSGVHLTATVIVALLVCLIPDDDRRPPVGDRHRRHGSADAQERHRDERPRGRGRGLMSTCCSSTRPARSRSATAWRRRSSPPPASGFEDLAEAAIAVEPLRRDARGSVDIVALVKGQARVLPREVGGATFIKFTAQTRMSGVESRRAQGPQGRRRRGQGPRQGTRRHALRRCRCDREQDRRYRAARRSRSAMATACSASST